jgi:hypothetical protein
MSDQAPARTEESGKYDDCSESPSPPKAPEIPVPPKCKTECECPESPGSAPPSCLETAIRDQNLLVSRAERAKAFIEELTNIQGKVTSALVDYTSTRYTALRKTWWDQHKLIVELVRKIDCAVKCWPCLLDCRLCGNLAEIRTLEERLNGPGDLAKGMGLPGEVNSLHGLKFWHERNVANMQARLGRVKAVLAAWEKPSDTLGEALELNQKLIDETQKILATDPAKAVFDVFMTLIQRHWAIRPRNPTTEEKVAYDWLKKYVKVCECPGEPAATQVGAERGQVKSEKQRDDSEDGCKPPACKCDEGTPDVCCGIDVGILSLRQRLIGPLPFIIEPVRFPDVICCLTKQRLIPASDNVAAAQANLAATATEIEQATKALEDRISLSAIEKQFLAGLPIPFDCKPYCKEGDAGSQPDQKQQNPQVQAN